MKYVKCIRDISWLIYSIFFATFDLLSLVNNRGNQNLMAIGTIIFILLGAFWLSVLIKDIINLTREEEDK